MTAATMGHDEALELAGLYALDVLTPDEKAEVDAHLASCALDHSEIGELGGVTPALGSLAEPLGAPASLKRRVMETYAAENPRNATFPTQMSQPARAALQRRRTPNWMGWTAAAVGLVLLAVLGAVGLNLKSQADLANQRAAEMTQ